VAMAALPVQISFAYKRAHAEQKQTQPDQRQAQPDQGQTQSEPEQAGADNQQSHKPSMSFWGAIGRLALFGLASPFYDLQDPVWGVLGLIILFVGIRIAWRMTQGQPDLDVTGPFNNSAPKLA
jgi:hypothetical protein